MPKIVGPQTGNAVTFDEKQPVQLPKEVEAAIMLAVRRAIRGLKAEVEAKRPRTVVQKNFNIGPGAFEESLRIHRTLVEENERAERLLLQLRQARAEYLAATGATLPKG